MSCDGFMIGLVLVYLRLTEFTRYDPSLVCALPAGLLKYILATGIQTYFDNTLSLVFHVFLANQIYFSLPLEHFQQPRSKAEGIEKERF